MQKLMSRFSNKNGNTQNTYKNLEKDNKRECKLPDFKTHYKPSIIGKLWDWQQKTFR